MKPGDLVPIRENSILYDSGKDKYVVASKSDIMLMIGVQGDDFCVPVNHPPLGDGAMMPGDVRTWVTLDVGGWRERYSGKTFMLLEEQVHAGFRAGAWDVLFGGRREVYSEDMIRTHSRPL